MESKVETKKSKKVYPKIPEGAKTLADVPYLMKEWHPTKNEYIDPAKISLGSHKYVWWKCEVGHEWQARVGSRVAGAGCPYCAGQMASIDNCLDTIRPDIAKEWHPTKNGDLTPKDVTAYSHRTVWWQCEAKGHEWKTRIVARTGTDTRTRKGTGCPYCAGRKVCEDNCLATLRPDIAKEWHPTKNGDLTPKDVTVGPNKKVWWKCEAKGHEWEARVSDRTGKKNSGCPYCAGQKVTKDNCLATVYPEVAKEWHPTKNGDKTPENTLPGTNDKVWWKCEAKGHEWESRVSDRTGTRMSKCPYCQGKRVCEDNCLATLKPEVAKDWHPTKNGDLTPKDVTPGSSKKVWWQCENGHEWLTAVRTKVLAKGNGCKICVRKK